MRPIPKQLRDEIAQDPFMKKCCLCNSPKVQWHHNLIYQGRQSNNPNTILPLCPPCHDQARNKEVKEQLDLIMLNRMPVIEIDHISKAIDYHHRHKYLKKKYA